MLPLPVSPPLTSLATLTSQQSVAAEVAGSDMTRMALRPWSPSSSTRQTPNTRHEQERAGSAGRSNVLSYGVSLLLDAGVLANRRGHAASSPRPFGRPTPDTDLLYFSSKVRGWGSAGSSTLAIAPRCASWVRKGPGARKGQKKVCKAPRCSWKHVYGGSARVCPKVFAQSNHNHARCLRPSSFSYHKKMASCKSGANGASRERACSRGSLTLTRAPNGTGLTGEASGNLSENGEWPWSLFMTWLSTNAECSASPDHQRWDSPDCSRAARTCSLVSTARSAVLLRAWS